jgi:hypothetical protein
MVKQKEKGFSSLKIANGIFNSWLLWDAQNSGKPTRIAQSALPYNYIELRCTSHDQKP